MRIHFFILLSCFTVFGYASLVPSPPILAAKSYILIDAVSGQIIVEHHADEQVPPASLTKMMSAYIADHQLASGNLHFDDQVHISVKAWSMKGSRMFIREGTNVSVEDLLRGVIIQSGNDATVALAEHIAGSEDAFVDLMNQHAARLNMNNSHFMNATGWPAENHYSTARDMATLARSIIQDYPQYYSLYSEKEFTYNNIKQDNRNKLLWRDRTVDGLKTGHTDEAGYCLVSSAKQNNMRLISAVMGTKSANARSSESQKLLTYGFRFFDTLTLYKEEDTLSTINLWMGTQDTLALGINKALSITIPKGQQQYLRTKMNVQENISAPIEKGQILGKITIFLKDTAIIEAPLVAQESISQGGLFKRVWDSIKRFFKNLIQRP